MKNSFLGRFYVFCLCSFFSLTLALSVSVSQVMGAVYDDLTAVRSSHLSPPTGFSVSTSGSTVTVTWSGVSGASGYKLYYGASSGNYIGSFDLGNVTTKVFDNVPDGTYYVVLTAYDSAGESIYSEEKSIIVSGGGSGGNISMITPYVNESDIRSIGLFIYGSHQGIDFQTTGDLKPFQAVSSGVVKNIQLIQTNNWYVELEIEYNSTYSVLYVFEPMTANPADGQTQLANIVVSNGQSVSQGDLIGYLYVPDAQAHVHFGLSRYVSGGGDPTTCPEPYFTPEARDSILNLIRIEYPNASICN